MINQRISISARYLIVITLEFFYFSTNLHAQVSGSDAYIKAASLELGISGAGGFEGCDVTVSPPPAGMHFRSDGTNFLGFVANPQLNSWATFDGDFFTSGIPENGWGFEIGTSGVSAGNNCYSVQQINGSIINWSHNLNEYSTTWEGDYTTGTNLHFKINYFLHETDLYYTTIVSITNNTASIIPSMYYYRNVDPDNNEPLTTIYHTQNTIVSEPDAVCNLAHVSATQSIPWNSYLGLAAIGNNWRASYGGFSNRDASDIWNNTGTGLTQTIGASAYDDKAISLAYRIQNLSPGATETFKFVVILDGGKAINAIDNLLNISMPDTIKTCGASASINIQGSNVNDFSWNWSPSYGLSSTSGSSVIANPDSTITYTVHGTPLAPCLTALTMSVTVEVTPDPGANPVITNVSPLCLTGSPIILIADSLGGTWSGIGITNSTSGNFSPAVSGPGSFMIIYSTPTGCNTSDSILITVNNPSDATISSVPPICADAPSFNLSSMTNGGTWSGPGITNSITGTFDPSITGAGTFTITHEISGSCGDTATGNIIVNPLPSPVLITDVNHGCLPLCIQFNEGSSGCNNIHYDFGDGDTTNLSSPNHCYNSASVFNAKVICTDLNGCKGTSNAPITVNPLPEVSFTISPLPAAEINSPVIFVNQSTPGTTSKWNFGDGSSLNASNFIWSTIHVYESPGDFCATLVSTTQAGCIDSVKNCLEIIKPGIIVPNVFTPNGDGENDIWMVSGEGITKFNCSIYNRWGIKIIELSNISEGWNGKISGGSVSPDGTYFYVIRASTLTDQVLEKQGFFQLIRN
jgi:gliding motility-associated-like protein